MPRRRQADLVSALSAMGLRFRRVSVKVEGDYEIADADWNYKDVPHLNQVHGWATNVNGVTDADVEASINLQRVLGMRLPLVLSHYDSGPERQSFFFTMLAWVVVGELAFESTPEGRTRVWTHYEIGAAPPWSLFNRFIGWLLTRNNRQLMTEDLPMRDRRGELRRWGYRFRGDGAPRDFRDSLAIERDNVLVPTEPMEDAAPARPAIRVSAMRPGEPYLWGRDDHHGLRFELSGDRLEVYPRLCLHEGASLDDQPSHACAIECPWHGRKNRPWATCSLGDGRQELETPYHVISLDDDEILVTNKVTDESSHALTT